MVRTWMTVIAIGAVMAACSPDGASDEGGNTVTTAAADGESESESGSESDSGSESESGSEGDGDGDPSCLAAEDPGACCQDVGPNIDACKAAGCWDVEPAMSYDDQCAPIELGDVCFPAVWEGMCFGTIKPDGCVLGAGDEVVYREVAPGEFIYLVGWELCIGGVPGWSHCFADPDSDPPGCQCLC